MLVLSCGFNAYADAYNAQRSRDVDHTKGRPATLDLEEPVDPRASKSTSDESMLTAIVGGGVTNFTGTLVSQAVQTGGVWEALFVFASHRHLGFEAGYTGSLNRIQAVGLTGTAYLVGTTAQTSLRLNATTHSVLQPFATVGVAWTHYALAGEATNVSGIRNDDNVIGFPLGAGVAIHAGQFSIDVRGVYRYAVSSDMFDTIADATGNSGKMTSWGARLGIGFAL